MQYTLVLSSSNIESQPLFSVVIPCHNAAKYFSETLESLVKQTEKDFDVVIIDDCSSDSAQLQSVVENFRDKLSLTLVRTAKNINGAGARNLGVELSHGKYIAFLDADDLFEPEKLQVCRDEIAQRSNENFIIYTQLKFKARGNSNFELRPLIGKPQRMTVGEYLFGNSGLMQTSTLVMPRKVFHKIEFNPDFRRHQDYDFVLRAATLGTDFVYIPQPLAVWHKPEKRKTTTITKGASTSYCFYWLEQMQNYLTVKEKALYLIKVAAPIAVLDGKFATALKLYFKNLTQVPLRIFVKSLFQSSKNLMKWVYAR